MTKMSLRRSEYRRGNTEFGYQKWVADLSPVVFFSSIFVKDPEIHPELPGE